MDDLTGHQLGPYRIVSQVGAGGMAAVYKAYHTSTDRHVAVKVLPRLLASDPQFTARFENEARLLARLQHPHILPLFDFGQAEGYAYFVMPLVETGTLSERLRGQPVPLDQLRTFVSQIGDALDYAHSRGLLHRDVKPSNVLVDERGNYLLTDFGIAKLVDGSSNLTATGTLIGTPAYMSPEQGQGRNLDRRSDLYSLGVIVYELAAGQVPFTADTPVAVIFKHVSEPLPSIEALNPNLPPALVQVINRALAKQPQDRYQTCHELIAAVETSLDTALAQRPLAATLLEPVIVAPPLEPVTVARPPVHTSASAPAPVYNPPPTGRKPQNTAPPAAPPPSAARSVPANPLRKWLRALPRPRGAGVLALVGLALVACLASYLLYPHLFGLAADPAATRTAQPTLQPTRAPTESAQPDELTTTPRPTATARPTRTPAPTKTIVPTTWSFRDDFEDRDSGWKIAADNIAALDYVDGEYSISIAEAGWYELSILRSAGEFSNVHLAVTARAVGAPTKAARMGLICGTKVGQMYSLGYSGDGYYAIEYWDGSHTSSLTNDNREWLPTTAVKQFADSYYLEADCGRDGTLRLTVNGVVLAEVKVGAARTTGSIGLFAETLDERPAEVRFDDLIVTKIESP